MENSNLSFTMTVDSKVDVIYIYNRGRKTAPGVVAKTLESKKFDNIYVDYDKDDNIFGIEILNPGKITLMEVLKLFEPPKTGEEL